MLIKINEHEVETGERPVETVEITISTHTDDDGIQHIETGVQIEYTAPTGAVVGDLTVYGAVKASDFLVTPPPPRSGVAVLQASAHPDRVRLDPATQG